MCIRDRDELAAKEAVRMVVQRGQRTVAEAEEPGVDVALVALDTLALQVQLGFGWHDDSASCHLP